MKPLTSRKNGFSLIEMVIVVIAMGILAAVLSPIAYTSLRAYDATLGDIVVLDKLRYATERLAREIREVNYDPPPPVGTDTGFAFISRGADSMSFTRTFFDSGGVESGPTVITVGNTGGAVTLAYSTPNVGAQVLTDELDNLAFSYLKADGTPATSNTDVRSVEISLTLSHNGNLYPQTTRVELKRYTGP